MVAVPGSRYEPQASGQDPEHERRFRGRGRVSILAPLGVVLLELWTDQHKRSVTWNEFNLAAAGVVALAGLICVALAVGLLSKRDP